MTLANSTDGTRDCCQSQGRDGPYGAGEGMCRYLEELVKVHACRQGQDADGPRDVALVCRGKHPEGEHSSRRIATLSSGLLWARPDVEKWAKATGRAVHRQEP